MIKVGNVLKNKTSGRFYVVITTLSLDGVFVAFIATCLGYIVLGMSWSQIATHFGF